MNKKRASTIIKQENVIKEHILTGCNVTKACEAANVSTSQFYEWMNKDIDFRNAIHENLKAKLKYDKRQFLKNLLIRTSKELKRDIRKTQRKLK